MPLSLQIGQAPNPVRRFLYFTEVKIDDISKQQVRTSFHDLIKYKFETENTKITLRYLIFIQSFNLLNRNNRYNNLKLPGNTKAS